MWVLSVWREAGWGPNSAEIHVEDDIACMEANMCRERTLPATGDMIAEKNIGRG